MPVPAVSVSVRIIYLLARIAADASQKKPTRFYAAAYVVMALAALRGIDAQRSTFDDDHGVFFSAIA